MRNKIEDPMREHSHAHNGGSRLRVGVAEPTAKWLVDKSGKRWPRDRCDKAVRVRMKIWVEHAACGKTFDHAQLLDSKQHQRCPDVIEKLDGDEQNPERNFVSLTLDCKRDTVVPNKHLNFHPTFKVIWQFL